MRSLRVGILLLGLIALPIDAMAATRDDPNDVRGRLDLRQVSRTSSRPEGAPALIHLQATTYGRWSLRTCERIDACSFSFGFDSRRGPGVDVYAAWNVDPERAPSCTIRNARTQRVLAVGTASKFRRSAFCSFERRILEGDGSVRWRVGSSWEATLDRAPDVGWFGGGS